MQQLGKKYVKLDQRIIGSDIRANPMVIAQTEFVKLVTEETSKLLAWASGLESSTNTFLEQAKALASRLGAYYRPDGLTEFGFWVPRLIGDVLHEREIYLEIFTPLEPINWRAREQRVKFKRDCLHLEQQGEFFWGVVAGLQPGNREQPGSFYWLRYSDLNGKLQTIRDLLGDYPYRKVLLEQKLHKGEN